MDIENFEREKTIFDNDEDVIFFKNKLTYRVFPAGPEPAKAILIRSENRHSCYRLAFGHYCAINDIYNAIHNKTHIENSCDIILFDTYLYTNPILDFWRENRLMRDVIPFWFDDSEGIAWDNMCKKKYPNEELRPQFVKKFEGERPVGFNRYYLDLANYTLSNVSLITNCFGASSTCELPNSSEQTILYDKINDYMDKTYHSIVDRKKLDNCLNPRVIYE